MNNINIDEDRFITDLYNMRNVFASNPSRDVINNDYAEFVSLNKICGIVFAKAFDTSYIFKNPAEIQKIANKYKVDSFKKFVEFASKNQQLLLTLFSNFTSMLDSIDYMHIPFYKHNKRFSEKDFKDIILSYFNTYGEKYYKIAKKYFDENRIQMKYTSFEQAYLDMLCKDCETEEEKEEIKKNNGLFVDFAGFFSNFIYLSSGYIICRYNGFNSWSASSLIHELGHAIDAETFLFPQQKKIPVLSDMLIEVPSTTFELGFFDYLIKNKIDETGGRILLNDRCMMIDDTIRTLKPIYDLGEFDMDFHGTVLLNNQEYNFRDDMLYGLGYYFALCFSILREEDKKEFLKCLNNVMTMRKESTLEELIEMSGVDPDKFISTDYVKPKVESEYLKLRKRFNV